MEVPQSYVSDYIDAYVSDFRWIIPIGPVMLSLEVRAMESDLARETSE